MNIVVDTPVCTEPGDNLTCEARSAEWCLKVARKVALPVGLWDAQPVTTVTHFSALYLWFERGGRVHKVFPRK